MKVFAIADLHLSLHDGVLTKPMARFGDAWLNHHEQIADAWRGTVAGGDLVLVPGDISWAMRPAEAAEDLAWLHALPGTKVLLNGNHDYWMPSSRRKLAGHLPASMVALRHEALRLGRVILFGTRLWNVPGLSLPVKSSMDGEPMPPNDPRKSEEDARLLERELGRLRLAADAAAALAREEEPDIQVCMTHFPPTDASGTVSAATEIIGATGATVCVFGHVHGSLDGPFSTKLDGVSYRMVAADAVGFRPVQIGDI